MIAEHIRYVANHFSIRYEDNHIVIKGASWNDCYTTDMEACLYGYSIRIRRNKIDDRRYDYFAFWKIETLDMAEEILAFAKDTEILFV